MGRQVEALTAVADRLVGDEVDLLVIDAVEVLEAIVLQRLEVEVGD